MAFRQGEVAFTGLPRMQGQQHVALRARKHAQQELRALALVAVAQIVVLSQNRQSANQKRTFRTQPISFGELRSDRSSLEIPGPQPIIRALSRDLDSGLCDS